MRVGFKEVNQKRNVAREFRRNQTETTDEPELLLQQLLEHPKA